jgi:hypothetical protein
VDVKAFIESGIIESVVLGFASEKEISELQTAAAQFPEVKAEWIAVSTAFESEATKHAVPAPASVKASVMAIIEANAKVTKTETPIISISQPNQTNSWKWLAAASVIISLGIGTMWFMNYNEMVTVKNQLSSAKSDMEKMDQEMTALSVEQEKAMEYRKVLAQLDTKNIPMSGTAMEPNAKVHIMWNENNKMAVLKSVAINSIPSEMQLQLWAIADGKPVSLGVFDVADLEQMTDPFLVDSKNISAFAITIEKRGGSEQPTMEKMVVMGAVNS